MRFFDHLVVDYFFGPLCTSGGDAELRGGINDTKWFWLIVIKSTQRRNTEIGRVVVLLVVRTRNVETAGPFAVAQRE